jgi:hypothetical protein
MAQIRKLSMANAGISDSKTNVYAIAQEQMLKRFSNSPAKRLDLDAWSHIARTSPGFFPLKTTDRI